MPAPELPTWQDCHELWSKQRRRQQREQDNTKPKSYNFQEENQSDPSFKSDYKNENFKPVETQETVGQVK